MKYINCILSDLIALIAYDVGPAARFFVSKRTKESGKMPLIIFDILSFPIAIALCWCYDGKRIVFSVEEKWKSLLMTWKTDSKDLHSNAGKIYRQSLPADKVFLITSDLLNFRRADSKKITSNLFIWAEHLLLLSTVPLSVHNNLFEFSLFFLPFLPDSIEAYSLDLLF